MHTSKPGRALYRANTTLTTWLAVIFRTSGHFATSLPAVLRDNSSTNCYTRTCSVRIEYSMTSATPPYKSLLESPMSKASRISSTKPSTCFFTTLVCTLRKAGALDSSLGHSMRSSPDGYHSYNATKRAVARLGLSLSSCGRLASAFCQSKSGKSVLSYRNPKSRATMSEGSTGPPYLRRLLVK